MSGVIYGDNVWGVVIFWQGSVRTRLGTRQSDSWRCRAKVLCGSVSTLSCLRVASGRVVNKYLKYFAGANRTQLTILSEVYEQYW